MPVLFVGHGSPLYAIEDNRWSRGFRALPSLIPKPSAILTISAHWFTDGTLITGNERPITIHDFFGFPRELNEVQYSAPGKLDLAFRIKGDRWGCCRNQRRMGIRSWYVECFALDVS